MKRRSASAFTLIEIVTAMAVILVLTGLVLGLAGFVQRKSALTLAKTQIEMLASACAGYKADNGTFPHDFDAADEGVTDKLKPKVHFDPTNQLYKDAGEFFYEELTGDKDLDGIPDADEGRYLREFDQKILEIERDPNTKKIVKVKYFKDPFGFAFGYSTAAAREELLFQKQLRDSKAKIPDRKTEDKLPGYNADSYDLWSTSGNKGDSTDPKQKSLEQAKWVKNW